MSGKGDCAGGIDGALSPAQMVRTEAAPSARGQQLEHKPKKHPFLQRLRCHLTVEQ